MRELAWIRLFFVGLAPSFDRPDSAYLRPGSAWKESAHPRLHSRREPRCCRPEPGPAKKEFACAIRQQRLAHRFRRGCAGRRPGRVVRQTGAAPQGRVPQRRRRPVGRLRIVFPGWTSARTPGGGRRPPKELSTHTPEPAPPPNLPRKTTIDPNNFIDLNNFDDGGGNTVA